MLERLRGWMDSAGASSAFISDPVSIGYMTGFLSEPHERLLALVLNQTEAVLIVPGLEEENASMAAREVRVRAWLDGSDPWREVAAALDGASTFRTFRQIILPNAYPALAALAILRFQGSWNEFQWPLIVLRSPEHLTLPLGLASFQGLFGVNWNWVLAGAMFNAVPIVLLVIFFQKYFIRSAASSAIKG